MSPSMLLGRIVLPAAALILGGTLAWNTLRSIAVRADSLMERTTTLATGPSPPGATDSSGRVTAEGRVVAYPGAEVTVGTEVLGTIVEMPAREHAAVHQGDLLV